MLLIHERSVVFLFFSDWILHHHFHIIFFFVYSTKDESVLASFVVCLYVLVSNVNDPITHSTEECDKNLNSKRVEKWRMGPYIFKSPAYTTHISFLSCVSVLTTAFANANPTQTTYANTCILLLSLEDPFRSASRSQIVHRHSTISVLYSAHSAGRTLNADARAHFNFDYGKYLPSEREQTRGFGLIKKKNDIDTINPVVWLLFGQVAALKGAGGK